MTIFRLTLPVLSAALLAACSARAPEVAERPGGPVDRPAIVPHEAWEEAPPVGHVAEAMRRNLPPGGALEFEGLTLTLLEMVAAAEPESDTVPPDGEPVDSEGAGGEPVDTALLDLVSGGEREMRAVPEGAAFNWNGFHIAVLAVNASDRGLGAGLVELEVATVESLPAEVAASTRAGDATLRLRVPHRIEMITLHHSGSAEPLRPEDDPVEKLRALQSWGRSARNWWDVPYHFLLDLDGTIYEGRDYHYMGETNTGYDPRGHLLISVIGNYSRQEPTPRQIEAIKDLMAWAAAEFDVPPERIYGHGDLANTSCPGTHLRRYLDDGTFRGAVERRLRAAGGAR